MNRLRVATRNLEWAIARTANYPTIQRRLSDIDADVVVLTEMRVATGAGWPHMLDAGTHPGICTGDKRKVAIVSKYPLTLVDDLGSDHLPPANFAAVDVDCPGGLIRVIGIVVRWAQRSLYLDHLPEALANTMTDRMIVAGDYNHRLPNGGPLARRLGAMLQDHGLSLHTGGEHAALSDERGLIDHIAATDDLAGGAPIVWPRHDPLYRNGTKEVTDHAGAAVDFTW